MSINYIQKVNINYIQKVNIKYIQKLPQNIFPNGPQIIFHRYRFAPLKRCRLAIAKWSRLGNSVFKKCRKKNQISVQHVIRLKSARFPLGKVMFSYAARKFDFFFCILIFRTRFCSVQKVPSRECILSRPGSAF